MHSKKFCLVLLFFSQLLFADLFAQAKEYIELPVLTVDAGEKLGEFKSVNGLNGGPRIKLADCLDNGKYFKAMSPSFIRLHDVPYAAMGAVDVHLIFPNFNADENNPGNYQFTETDLYIKAIKDCGSDIIFRLGESIEKCRPQLYANPPSDIKKWVRICCNIIRHYNMGWNNGFKWNIRYWEIGNEPNISDCWSGTMSQYCDLYKGIAIAIKKLDPTLKVGGPALAGSVNTKEGKEFLNFCITNHVPLDFVSWHGYETTPNKIMSNIERGIKTLKELGLDDAETIFDEWNYNAGGWGFETKEKERENFSKTVSASGAAYTASVLSYMLDSELDISCYYSGYGTAFKWGLFNDYNIPQKPYYAFVAYNQLVQSGTRILATGGNRESGLGIIASFNDTTLRTSVLISNFDDNASRYILQMKNFPKSNQIYCTEFVIDENHSLEWDREQVLSSSDSKIIIELPKSTIRLVLFTQESLKGQL